MNRRLLLSLMVIIATILAGCVAPGTSPQSAASVPSSPVVVIPTPQQGATLIALPSFAELINLVEHSVVEIDTEEVIQSRFIQRTLQGAGSGWVIDASGIIVTNNHVVEGAQTITVRLQDGRTLTPESVKTDAATDLAVLKINAGSLPALRTADISILRVGDWVLAIGNALGQGISAKDGIVSRLGVNVQLSQTESYNNLIETNAAINPGNSGGPLVNLSGEVVGITTLKPATAGVEGMGYAINIGDALPVIQRLSQ